VGLSAGFKKRGQLFSDFKGIKILLNQLPSFLLQPLSQALICEKISQRISEVPGFRGNTYFFTLSGGNAFNAHRGGKHGFSQGHGFQNFDPDAAPGEKGSYHYALVFHEGGHITPGEILH